MKTMKTANKIAHIFTYEQSEQTERQSCMRVTSQHCRVTQVRWGLRGTRCHNIKQQLKSFKLHFFIICIVSLLAIRHWTGRAVYIVIGLTVFAS